MFMVRSEFENIKKLLRVKIRTEQKGFLWHFVLTAVVFVFVIVPMAINIGFDGSSGLNFHHLTDISTFFFFGMIIALAIIMFSYRKTNDALSVFPQTNSSRFVASEVSNYISIFFLGLVALVLYLLQYSMTLIVSVFRENVIFALEFNIGFIIVGFITFLMYGFLVVAVIGLIGTVLRKWSYYAVMAFAAFISLGITNFETVIGFLPLAFGFLVNEPSFGLFMSKAIALWLVIFALSFSINFHTVYYKSQHMTITRKAVVICIAIVAVIASLSVVVFSYTVSYTIELGAMDVHEVDDFTHDFFADAEEIRIDISHLPRGSDITLTTEGIADDVTAGGQLVITGRRWQAFVGGLDALDNIQGDTLIIQFRPPFYEVNGIEKAHHANPRLTANLDGNHLHLIYKYDNVHVVSIPVWGIASQFEMFDGMGVVREYWLMSTVSANMSANIFIRVE